MAENVLKAFGCCRKERDEDKSLVMIDIVNVQSRRYHKWVLLVQLRGEICRALCAVLPLRALRPRIFLSRIRNIYFSTITPLNYVADLEHPKQSDQRLSHYYHCSVYNKTQP